MSLWQVGPRSYMPSWAPRRRVLCAGLLCVLSGCAALVPKLQAPQLTVSEVELQGGNSQQQQLRLTLHVVNPNTREIAVRGIECTLELEGRSFAEGVTDAAFTLPARGETDFVLDVTAHLHDALTLLAGGLLHKSVQYRLYGQVHLRGGIVRHIAFDQRGQLRL